MERLRDGLLSVGPLRCGLLVELLEGLRPNRMGSIFSVLNLGAAGLALISSFLLSGVADTNLTFVRLMASATLSSTI